MSLSCSPACLSTAAVAGIGPSSISTGSTPTTFCAMTRARGLRPSSSAFCFSTRSTAAAPSVIWLELPAVIEC